MSAEPPIHSVRFIVDVSMEADADPIAVADALLDYLCADEINGLPEAIQSVDGVDVTRA
jgi:hypothetical protein